MLNTPTINLGIISIASNSLDKNEVDLIREKLYSELVNQDINVTECKMQVTNEVEAIKALTELKSVNALVLLICDNKEESAAIALVQKFDGPVMIIGVKDENKDRLQNNPRDTYSGILSINYNLALRNTKAYIPDIPITGIKGMIEQTKDFVNIARVCVSIKKLKIISFGPRPYNCFSPIQPVLDMGIEIEENSDLDLIKSFNAHLDDPRISDVAQEMIDELENSDDPDLMAKLAAYELTLIDWYLARRGTSKYGIFNIKCSASFVAELGFCPCFVHSRLSNKGIIVTCNDDIYGALSSYISLTASNKATAQFNINNNVPKDIYKQMEINYRNSDLFIGLSCGNIPSSLLSNYSLSYNIALHQEIEPNEKPTISKGTLKGNILASEITLFRIMPNHNNQLQAYIAEGESLDCELSIHGSAGIFAIDGMGKFYKEVLINNYFNQHTSAAFSHNKKVLFNALRLLNIEKIYIKD